MGGGDLGARLLPVWPEAGGDGRARGARPRQEVLVCAALALLVVSCLRQGGQGFWRSGPEDPHEDPIASLLSAMTLEEKARQLSLIDGTSLLTNGKVDPAKVKAALGDGLGMGKTDVLGRNVDPRIVNEIQRAVVGSSRHNIGFINAEECQHGVQGDWHTMFPSPYSMAAAFDPDLMHAVGKVIGTEARAGGITECYGPVCGLAREPRWGRAEEEMGEDPFLAGELAAAMVRGMVGSPPGEDNVTRLRAPTTVAPLLKHYAAHSVPEGGHNTAPTLIGRRTLQEVFLPPFMKAVQAGAQGVMSSYNEIDGVPASGDHWLLTEKLRGEFGFDGYVAADYGAVSKLELHGVAANDSEAVRGFLEAGGAMNGHDMGSAYEAHVVELVRSGRMPQRVLDDAAGRVLRVKARLGLIGNVSGMLVDESLVETNLGDNEKHVAVAERAALQSVVLLNNAGSVLPLDLARMGKARRLVVVGPNADQARAGDYSAAGWAGGSPNGGGNINNANTVTILEGLKKESARLNGPPVEFHVGTGVTHGDTKTPYFSTVQRHSFRVKATFTPSAPSSPYKKSPGGVVVAGTDGLEASYFAGTRLAGNPVLVRRDAAINFHWFALGPDPTRMRSGAFSVRWRGTITSDGDVDGALFNLLQCRGKSCPTKGGSTPNTLGSRLFLNGKLIIDNWGSNNGSTPTTNWTSVSGPVNLVRGQGMDLVMEYWQSSTDGNPNIALQWSLLPTTTRSSLLRLSSSPQAHSNTGISAAAAAAAKGSAAVVVLGGANNAFDQTTEGEGLDRASLALAGDQLELLQAVVESCGTKVPVIVVLVDGKPTAEPYIKGLPAVIAGFQGGQAGGTAVAQIISGAYNPTGKLPVTFPVSADVLPVYYNHMPTASRSGYTDVSTSVLWAFGHGLSYTTFSYSGLLIEGGATPAQPVANDGRVTVSFNISNTGKVVGTAVPQLYIRHTPPRTVTSPVLSLKGFTRVDALSPGETRAVSFPPVDVAKELRLLGRDYNWAVEPGQVQVLVGDASDNIFLKGSFEVV